MSEAKSLLRFAPLDLALSPVSAADATAHGDLLFTSTLRDGSATIELLHGRATAAAPLYAYQPQHALFPQQRGASADAAVDTMALGQAEGLAASVWLCTLHQWHHCARLFPQFRGAVAAGIAKFCPFAPLVFAANSLENTANFEDVLRFPAWQLWLLQDYFSAVARAALPVLIADDLLARKLNLIAAKLLNDGALALQAPPQPTAGAGAALAQPDSYTMEEVAVLEQHLLAHEGLSLFNITPSETFCPITTESTIVLMQYAPETFACSVIVTAGAGGRTFTPALQRAPRVTSKNSKEYFTDRIASGQVLKELDIACFLPDDQRDDRVVQLDVIVVDCSGSMSMRAFEHDADMARSDAAQILFNMLVDKYRSMEIRARVACVLFGSSVMLACPFTDDLAQFETLLGRAEDMGQTRLWDAIGRGIEEILKEKKALTARALLHPAWRGRIVAVTDGLDNASTLRNVQVARHCRNNSVALDAFVLGTVDDTELRVCSAASGGLVLQFRDIQDASELFEQPVVVSMALRPAPVLPPLGPTRESLNVFADLHAFPRTTSSVARAVASVAPVRVARQPPAHTAAAQPSVSQPGAPKAGVVAAPTAPGSTAAPTSTTGSAGGRERRLKKELDDMVSGQGLAAGIVAVDRSDTNNLRFLVRGPDASLYAGTFLTLTAAVPVDYPFKPLRFGFDDSLFHPQINNGRSCDVSTTSWSPSSGICEAISSLRTMLRAPDLSSSINSWAASLLKATPDQFEAQVRLTLPALTETNARARSSTWTDVQTASASTQAAAAAVAPAATLTAPVAEPPAP